ncbi:hypothetical protein [Engelhardtia mirabilis]|uniref:FG-GAP repeat protein n=1 Tax=Engelhardtia mirabilis TaxID=2528011 RepID=A0A518BP16_9BACT|nr:hypothetical protein Pla133_38210 [Planctomycetes bacterium Pla133]QDV03045.1 hypothetical protein Pla86_38200 [Planctomycetes bacterium Pla86]
MLTPFLLSSLSLVAPIQTTPWALTDYVLPDNGHEFARFGTAVAVHGNLAVVGAENQSQLPVDNTVAGAAYLFERQLDGGWLQLAELWPEDLQNTPAFGSALALEGGILAVGVPGDDSACPGQLGCISGAVTIFEQTPSSEWNRLPLIVPADTMKLARFGAALSLSGPWLAVGAPGDGNTGGAGGGGNGPGAVYLFERTAAGQWIERQKLAPADLLEDDRFGNSVSIQGDRLVVGAPPKSFTGRAGSVYTFELQGGQWSSTGRLFAPLAAGADELGFSVALDGDVVAAGARLTTNVEVFERTGGGAWAPVQTLDGAIGEFGYAVALDGDVLVVGAPSDLSASIQVHRRDAQGNFVLEQSMDASGAGVVAQLGRAIAIEGGLILAGAPGDTVGGAEPSMGSATSWELDFVVPEPSCDGILELFDPQIAPGLATALGQSIDAWSDDLVALGSAQHQVDVLERQGSRLALAATLTIPGAPLGDAFAWSVAASPTTVAVTASGDDEAGPNAGAVYVFEKPAGQWLQTQKLFGAGPLGDEGFGTSVATDGATLLVGAQNAGVGGAAFVFERDATGWVQVAVLSPPDVGSGDRFGYRVEVLGDRAAVAGIRNDSITFDSGAVWTFRRGTDGQWINDQKLIPPPGGDGAWFGSDLALDGSRLLIGARLFDLPATNAGAAFLYALDPVGGWELEATLEPLDPEAEALFGAAVDLRGDSALVGAPQNDALGHDTGAAYLFHRVGGQWVQTEKLHRTGAAMNENLGAAVGLTEELALVGASASGHDGTMAVFVDGGPTPAPRLSLDPAQVAVGQAFAWTVCRGEPGNPVLLMLTAVETLPIFEPVGVVGDELALQALVGVFDDLGEWRVPATAPAIPPFTLRFEAWALGFDASVVSSPPATLAVQ